MISLEDFVVYPLTFDQLRAANNKRCHSAFTTCNNWTAADWVCATAGELGEAANLIKKHKRDGVLNKDELAKELADVVTYLDLLASHYGIDLGEAVRSKFNEVSDRVKSEVKL